MTAMPDHALQYAGRGWPVFTVSGYKIPFKGTHGHLDASTDAAVVTEMWRKRPRANIALATGSIVVIDADGPGALDRLKAFGQLPRTLTSQTSRGFHFFFRAPAGMAAP